MFFGARYGNKISLKRDRFLGRQPSFSQGRRLRLQRRPLTGMALGWKISSRQRLSTVARVHEPRPYAPQERPRIAGSSSEMSVPVKVISPVVLLTANVTQSWLRLFEQRPAEVKWIPAGLC